MFKVNVLYLFPSQPRKNSLLLLILQDLVMPRAVPGPCLLECPELFLFDIILFLEEQDLDSWSYMLQTMGACFACQDAKTSSLELELY